MNNLILQLIDLRFEVVVRKDNTIITISFQSNNFKYISTINKISVIIIYIYDSNNYLCDIKAFDFCDDAIEFIVNKEASFTCTN